MRILAIDWGEKRMGLAVGDSQHGVATPLKTVAREGGIVETLAKRAQKEGADFILLGLPLSLSGENGPMADTVREFGKMLGSKAHIPVFFRDERLTSVGARRHGIAKERLDAAVAALLLQEYFEEIGATKHQDSVV